MKNLLLIISVSLLAFSSCKKDNNEKKEEKIFKSEVQSFQHGKAWTWYEEDESKNPVRLAIAFDDAALNSLDTNGATSPGHHHQNSLSLKFHSKASVVTPFNHALLDWNPKGHEPEIIYGIPHFDFHFYMQSETDRLAIPLYEHDSTKFKNAPAPGYMPPTYINPGGGVPQMGAHWIDFTTPEINGQAFTQTFLMGSYDGNVTFWEPMITGKFFRENPGFQRSIPQPTRYQKTGWYPTKMRIEKKDGVNSVILEGFVNRQPS